MLVGGAALAATSLAILLVAGHAAVAVVGLVLVGVGVANAVPLLFSAAGRVPPAGPSLAAVFTIGYLGFILGPPVIGVLADTITLTAALAVVCVALVLVAALGGRAVGDSRAASESLTEPRARGRRSLRLQGSALPLARRGRSVTCTSSRRRPTG